MKKYLLLALAAMAFAACSEPEEGVNPSEKGEMEQSYLAVTLMADDMGTRAAGDKYDNGIEAERAVKSAYFFLFDDEGNAFPIDGTNINHKQIILNENGTQPGDGDPDGQPNVSDVKDKVLVFENYKGEYPAKMVVVLNWVPASNASYDLSALAPLMLNLQNTEGAFVMSNAVYATEDSKIEVNATALTEANIAKKEADALANPVKVYVERIAAKVTVNTTAENKYNIGKEIDGDNVYAKVLGWDFYNEYYQSHLLKDIEPTWTNLGFSWNDPAWFRSYWTKSQTTAFDADKNKVSYNTLANAVGAADYCGENTYNDNRTKVVIKAQLVGEDGTTPVEVATWYGNDYVGEEALRTVVANTLASQLYYQAGSAYRSILPAHLKVVEANETNPNTTADLEAYHVFFQLSPTGEGQTWFTYSSTDGYKAADVDAINVILGGVEPALLYNGGQTYYFTDIKHLGAPGSVGEFGVVRNHSYVVNITSIDGFGTPVYDGNTMYDPEKPEDITTYVSAEVRILSWRVVENNYDI